jgi:hypothetical protein
MDLSGMEFFGLTVTAGAVAGVVAGVANQLAKAGHDWLANRRESRRQAKELEHQTTTQTRELEHQQAMQARELEHQRALQREDREHQESVRRTAAFFDARKDLLPLAVDVGDWIDWEFGRLYGADVDYHQVARQTPRLTDAGAAVASLTRIAGEHPGKDVRDRARRLRDRIAHAYNTPNADGRMEPREGTMGEWFGEVDDLIQAHHDPDYHPLAY